MDFSRRASYASCAKPKWRSRNSGIEAIAVSIAINKKPFIDSFMFTTNRAEIYYGWKIVAAILVMLTFATGLSFYNHAVILNALAKQPVFTVQSASIAVSLFFLSGGFTGLWVAKLIQQFDVRICICLGAVISCLALTSLAWVETIWQLYAVYLLFGVGFSASNLIPATTLVTRWFHKKRAMALSIASTGLSLGGVLITPICAVLVESIGLARAAPIMGGMFLIGVIPVAVIWLRPNPASMGLTIDREVEHSVKKDEAQINLKETTSNLTMDHFSQGTSFAEARRGRFFWGVSMAYIFLMLAQVGGISHQYGLAREILNEGQTAVAVAILPIASIVGRLAGGWLVEQISIRVFAIVMMILQVISLGFLAGGYNTFSLCAGLALFGITVGNLLMLQPLLLAHAFGIKEYPRIFAVSNLMSSWGTAAGPTILGVAYAASQNLYSMPYLIAAGAGLLGLLFFLGGGKVRGE